jgi:hypothetical protein
LVSSQDEDSEFTLASDFEIGHFFRERIVPRAVLYFTGEAIEDDDNVCGAEGWLPGCLDLWVLRHSYLEGPELCIHPDPRPYSSPVLTTVD